jgi:hypothetical protein
VNNSNEDLLITVKNKEIIVSWDILSGNHIDYYENGIIVDRLYIDRGFRSGEYYLQNHFLPYNNRYIDGSFYWKYTIFFRRRTSEHIYEYDRERFLEIWGEENEGQFPQNTIFEYRKLNGSEILNIFIEEFIITDISGNIIMTLNDIKEVCFEENIVATHIEEYTEDFYNLPRYRNFGNNENHTILYGIFITDEILQEGRRKNIVQSIE